MTFRRIFETVRARGGSASHALRDAAFARFEALGLPTTRDEAWRFTSVAALGKIPFAAPSQGVSPASGVREHVMADDAAVRLVLVNGRFAPELSRVPSLPDGARVGSLAAALQQGGDGSLFRLVGASEDGAFPSLNAALAEDVAAVVLARGVVLERPVHVLCFTDGAGEPAVSSPRVLVSLGEGAQAAVIETHAGTTGETFANAVTEIELAATSVLEHVVLQEQGASAFHVSTTKARLGRSAALKSHVLSLGARLSRHDLAVDLAGEGASCELFGLSLLSGSQHADHHTFVDHAVPRCSSNQVYKGAYDDSSRGVFNGAVRVRKDAQKTDAHQQNRNLILGKGALVDTKPELEIHADDVRCTHGATIGRLDEDQHFYLVARGISPEQARRMLVAAFLQEQVSRIGAPAAREHAAVRLAKKLAELEPA